MIRNYACMCINYCIHTFLICSDTPITDKLLAVPNSLAVSANEDKKEEKPCSPQSMTGAQGHFYTNAKETAASQEVERCIYSMFI